jgi:hypothetical protein
MLQLKKLTAAEQKVDEIKLQNEVDRISQLDPNSKAAKRRAAFYERCKITDTKLQNRPPKNRYGKKTKELIKART